MRTGHHVKRSVSSSGPMIKPGRTTVTRPRHRRVRFLLGVGLGVSVAEWAPFGHRAVLARQHRRRGRHRHRRHVEVDRARRHEQVLLGAIAQQLGGPAHPFGRAALRRRLVDHRVEAAALQCGEIAVAIADQFFDIGAEHALAAAAAVEHGHAMAARERTADLVRADEAGAAEDQDVLLRRWPGGGSGGAGRRSGEAGGDEGAAVEHPRHATLDRGTAHVRSGCSAWRRSRQPDHSAGRVRHHGAERIGAGAQDQCLLEELEAERRGVGPQQHDGLQHPRHRPASSRSAVRGRRAAGSCPCRCRPAETAAACPTQTGR